ncbi:hypothetical protein GGX14DRAFT_599489, partial [Mycena pura]
LIAGTIPGVLDPHQPSRLLRRPSSTLSFASFDPRVASADHGWDLRSLSLNEELYRPKRVVIETTCSGESFWRFVPRARLDDAVIDEGKWPRVIDICGQLVECSQDQWDIYKLDVAYDCLVRAPPELTVITRATPKPTEATRPLGKHRLSSVEPCPEMPPTKTVHLEEEEEVADMIIDDDVGPTSYLFDSLRTLDDPDYYTRPIEDEEPRNAVNYSPTKASTAKRTRTVSPGAAKRELEKWRLEREKQKQQRRERERNLLKEQKFRHFLNEVYSEVPNGAGPRNESGDEEIPASELDPEAERMAAIAESRRKLAELEADRPLWEQEAKKREKREKEAQEAQRAKAERRAAEARKAEEERSAKERERQAAQEQQRLREAQERARYEREKRQRNERLSYGRWTTQRALERYKILSDTFESTKFSAEEQLTFEAIPWPVLHPPFSFSVEDIDWAAVESFFNAVKVHMRPQDYASLVQKSHRRFHPDRWRSRGLLKTVVDEAERECLEVGRCSARILQCDIHFLAIVAWQHRPSSSIRSAGDVPSSSTIRSPEPVRLQSSRYSESHVRSPDSNLPRHSAAPPALPRGINSAGLVIERARSTASPIPEQSNVPAALPTPSPPAPAAPPVAAHNVSLHSRTMTFFGYGRGASRARKQLVSMWYNLAWGSVQIVLIITMLSIAAHTESKTMPGRNEWIACDRPLAAWNCIYIFRVAFSSTLTYWGWRRDRDAHPNTQDVENQADNAPRPAPASSTAHNPSHPTGTTPLSNGHPPEVPALPHTVLYSRHVIISLQLSILSSLFTLSWFLTAHILEYTSIRTCRFSSPHIWWLTFGILCIMYLVILEVILLGFIVFVIAPIIFLVWNIFLMCLGRHPMQNPGMIRQVWPIHARLPLIPLFRPDVAKLSPSVVDRIPLVMYIPPPPDAAPGSIPVPQSAYTYPPKLAPPPVQRRHRFKFLRRNKKRENPSSDVSIDATAERKRKHLGEPQSWEDHWEQTGYPFVMLEGNRAACAVCLMDFEEPKRIAGYEPAPSSSQGTPSTPAIQEIPVEPHDSVPNDSTRDAENQLKLEDAGEGAQPLRLLACGHVFHKTCLDPWLTDVSGRCPVCQRPVALPPKPNKKR